MSTGHRPSTGLGETISASIKARSTPLVLTGVKRKLTIDLVSRSIATVRSSSTQEREMELPRFRRRLSPGVVRLLFKGVEYAEINEAVPGSVQA